MKKIVGVSELGAPLAAYGVIRLDASEIALANIRALTPYRCTATHASTVIPATRPPVSALQVTKVNTASLVGALTSPGLLCSATAVTEGRIITALAL